METAVSFAAGDTQLFGILHEPESDRYPSAVLLMVVGGPQTRVGSHRSYTLIARELCRQGLTVMRFDYEGLGDSEGGFVGFSQAGRSLDAAIAFLARGSSSALKIVLWALCDGSAACAMHARNLQTPVLGMVLCNPYVHSVQGQAKAYLKHYYLQRLLDRSFWSKVFSLRINPFTVAASFVQLVAKAGQKSGKPETGSTPPGAGKTEAPALNQEGVPGVDPPHLPDTVMQGLERYPGALELILSGDDLTAREFLDLYKERGTAQRRKHAHTGTATLPGADHTFTTSAWKQAACDSTIAAWNRILGTAKENR
jgi:uncharacterized protein